MYYVHDENGRYMGGDVYQENKNQLQTDANVIIEYIFTPGLTDRPPVYYSAAIKKDNATFKGKGAMGDKFTDAEASVEMSADKFEALLRSIEDLHFLTLETIQGGAYIHDMPVSTISITINGQTKSVSSSDVVLGKNMEKLREWREATGKLALIGH